MKFAILVCAVLATALAAPNVDKDQVKASAQKLKQAHETCNNDPATHIDIDALKKAHDEGKHEEPANIGAHTLCISKNLGWQNADGSVNTELIRSRTNSIFGESPKIDEIVTECAQAQSTPEATAKHLFDCYRKHTPRPSGTHPHDH